MRCRTSGEMAGWLVAAVVGLGAVGEGVAQTGAAAGPAVDEQATAWTALSPDCGPLAVYASARVLGVTVPVDQVVKPDFVSRTGGSTPADLERAARSIGLVARTATGLGVSDLLVMPTPAILFVRRHGGERRDHYVVFLGMKGDRAVVLDPGRATVEMTLEELSRRWRVGGDGVTEGGIATVVSRSTLGPVGATPGRLVALMALVAAGVSIWVSAHASSARVSRSAAAAAVVVLMAGAVNSRALMVPTARVSPGVVDGAAAARAESVRFVTAEEAFGRGQGGALFIDARSARDFGRSRVMGAISLPHPSDYATRSRVLRGIPRERRLVVYCQNERCAAAVGLAAELLADGYRHVEVIRGGLDAWDERALGTDVTPLGGQSTDR